MKKFDIEFKQMTANKFPFLRFLRADYSEGENKLTIFFLAKASAIDSGLLTDSVKKEIDKYIIPLFEGLPETFTYQVKYTKVLADEDTVRVKLITALQKYIGQAFSSIKQEDIEITINDYIIDIKIKAVCAYYAMLKASDVKDRIIVDIQNNFVEDVNFEVTEKYQSEEEKQKINKKSVQIVENAGFNCNFECNSDGSNRKDVNDAFEGMIDPFSDTIIVYADTRQIKVEPIEILVGKQYLASMPMYISDVKDTTENAILCGKVQGFEKREYKNKNYGLIINNSHNRFKKNTTDEKLPMYSFTMDDTTGKIAVVYFARDTKNDAIDMYLKDDIDVVIQGKVGERNGNKQILVDKMWLANIDFSSISQDRPKKEEAKYYKILAPEKYTEESQCNITDLIAGKKDLAPALKGKTYVAFDLETTGLDISQCLIVQIGAYKIIDGKIVETFNTYINPMCHIPESSTKIHGIVDDDVKTAPEFEEVLPDFYKFTRGATLVGHNLFGFDLPILSRCAKEYGYTFDNPMLDTFIIAKKHLKLPSNKLEALAKYFEIDLSCAHNANFDALATAKLFIVFAEKYL